MREARYIKTVSHACMSCCNFAASHHERCKPQRGTWPLHLALCGGAPQMRAEAALALTPRAAACPTALAAGPSPPGSAAASSATAVRHSPPRPAGAPAACADALGRAPKPAHGAGRGEGAAATPADGRGAGASDGGGAGEARGRRPTASGQASAAEEGLLRCAGSCWLHRVRPRTKAPA